MFKGALLQQIIKEALSNGAGDSQLRLVVRNGTPVSVAALLAACVAPPPRLPDPGAALLIELHERRPSQQNIKEEKILPDGQRFGFKVSSIISLNNGYVLSYFGNRS